MDVFLKDLNERTYHYRMNNGMEGWIHANPREVKLFDISIPEQCVPSLLNDLAPFVMCQDRYPQEQEHLLSVRWATRWWARLSRGR